MKTYIAILLLSCLYSWNATSQEIVEFKKSKLDKSVFLSIKDKSKEKSIPDKANHISFEREGSLKWFRDCQQLFKKEFSNLTDEEYAYLKDIKWYMWIFHDGTCQHQFFCIPNGEETFKHVKDLETHLANLVKQMDNLRFQPDQIVLSNPRNPNNNMGLTAVPLYYLRKKIDDK